MQKVAPPSAVRLFVAACGFALVVVLNAPFAANLFTDEILSANRECLALGAAILALVCLVRCGWVASRERVGLRSPERAATEPPQESVPPITELAAALARRTRGPEPDCRVAYPPLPVGPFIEAMRPRMEQTLFAVATVIDEARLEPLPPVDADEVIYLFADLLRDALWTAHKFRQASVGLAARQEPVPSEQPVEKKAPVRPSLRGRAEQTMERVADTIRDTLLDLDLEGEDRPPRQPPVPLPPLDPQALAEALRDPVKDTIRRLAALVNEAPDARALLACEPDLRPLIETLLSEGLARAEALRLDAAAANGAGPGSWARKYRRMKVVDGELPQAAQ